MKYSRFTINEKCTYSISEKCFNSIGIISRKSAEDAAIQKKIYESGTTALIILNEEMENITKIAKSLEESRLLIQGISETNKNETKEQKGQIFQCY